MISKLLTFSQGYQVYGISHVMVIPNHSVKCKSFTLLFLVWLNVLFCCNHFSSKYMLVCSTLPLHLLSLNVYTKHMVSISYGRILSKSKGCCKEFILPAMFLVRSSPSCQCLWFAHPVTMIVWNNGVVYMYIC